MSKLLFKHAGSDIIKPDWMHNKQTIYYMKNRTTAQINKKKKKEKRPLHQS